MQKLEIAGIRLGLNSNNRLTRTLEIFRSCSDQLPDIQVGFQPCAFIPEPDGRIVMSDKMKWFYSPEKHNNVTVCFYHDRSDHVQSIMKTDHCWENAYITYIGHNLDSRILSGAVGEVLFRNRILFHQGIMIHASAVEWEGQGIIFSAPSGTGKSTQAQLWVENKGAVVLNGDRSAVRIGEGQAYVYGSPWCGSSSLYLNRQAPLKTVVILEQAGENHIELLNRQEALCKLMPRCFLPYYDIEGRVMDMALKNLEKIIEVTRVYLLKCRPDAEAVELVCRCIR